MKPWWTPPQMNKIMSVTWLQWWLEWTKAKQSFGQEFITSQRFLNRLSKVAELAICFNKFANFVHIKHEESLVKETPAPRVASRNQIVFIILMISIFELLSSKSGENRWLQVILTSAAFVHYYPCKWAEIKNLDHIHSIKIPNNLHVTFYMTRAYMFE